MRKLDRCLVVPVGRPEPETIALEYKAYHPEIKNFVRTFDELGYFEEFLKRSYEQFKPDRVHLFVDPRSFDASESTGVQEYYWSGILVLVPIDVFRRSDDGIRRLDVTKIHELPSYKTALNHFKEISPAFKEIYVDMYSSDEALEFNGITTAGRKFKNIEFFTYGKKINFPDSDTIKRLRDKYFKK